MTKKTIKEHIAELQTENKYQTTSINELKDLMKEHISSSTDFRKQCAQNAQDIKWIKRIGAAVFGSSGLFGAIYIYFRNKFGG